MAFGFGMGFPRNEPFAGGPSLNLQFAGNTVLDPSITFTRALNTATYFNSAGVLTTANANVARFDYDPATLAPRGLLIEEARTNLILQSRDMTQAAWTKTDVTPNRNQVGIDGVANTACLLTEGSAGTAVVIQTGATITAGSTVTHSVVLKRGNTDWMRIIIRDPPFTDGANAWFNLNTGAKGAVAAVGAGTNISSTITNLGGGWYRCTLTCLPNGTYTNPVIGFVSASADNSGTRVSGATYIVDCAQLEVGAFATSVIPTSGTALTRNADVASVNTLTPWYNASEGTLYGEVSSAAIAVSFTSRRIANLNDGTEADRITVGWAGAASVAAAFVTDNSVTQATFTSPSGAYPFPTKVALAYKVNDFQAAVNGSAFAADTSGTVPTVNRMTIGDVVTGGNGTQNINGHIRRITYYPRRLSNAELQAITS